MCCKFAIWKIGHRDNNVWCSLIYDVINYNGPDRSLLWMPMIMIGGRLPARGMDDGLSSRIHRWRTQQRSSERERERDPFHVEVVGCIVMRQCKQPVRPANLTCEPWSSTTTRDPMIIVIYENIVYHTDTLSAVRQQSAIRSYIRTYIRNDNYNTFL